MKPIWYAGILFSLSVLGWSQQPAVVSLSMVSPDNRVILKVANGTITSVTINGQAVPLDRVKLEGNGLKVMDAQGAVVGSMAQLPKEGPAALQPLPPASPKVDVFTDNPTLQVSILNSRQLSVVYDGKPVPANQIVMDRGELRIFNSDGDLLRIIPADSSRLANRRQ
jgi:hypothetical protein